ncbi:retrovirus-related pol polyprotein from transposon TNT 1-94 [Tanacetum coccineum]
MANVSKSFSIPDEESSDDTSGVARKFLNEIFKDEIVPIVNQVDARVQNFENHFVKEATKFVRDFKSLAKEADNSLDKIKVFEIENDLLLKVVVSQDIMSIVQNNSVVDTSDLHTELDPQLGDLKGKSINTQYASNTLDHLSQKLEDENRSLEFQGDETNALLKLVTSNSVPITRESSVLKNDKVIAPGMFRINPFKTSREAKPVPNKPVKGLGHNLFLVSKFCDSNLEVAFRRNTCYVQNLEGVDFVGISRQASSVKTPQQNGAVKRKNRTLVKGARTMLIFSCALLFLWAEAIATACYTQNRSIIHCRFNKTPYELINGIKPDISFLHVFGALCYPKNDREDLGKLGAEGDIRFFIGYSPNSCAYTVYNRRTKKIIETMNVTFDELSTMTFEQRSSKPRLQGMASGQISSGLDLTYAPSTITSQKPTEHNLDLLFEAMYNDYISGQPSAATRTSPAAQAHQVLQTPTATTTLADTAPTPTNSSSQAAYIPNSSQDVDELEPQPQHAQQQDDQALL